MMIKKELTIEEVKQIQLSILGEISDFCNKNSIAFFLIAGSLIGAVRHKGYIPWDDDIDICMKRNDFEQFKREYCGLTTYLLSNDYSEDFFYPYIKVCKRNTLSIETGTYSKEFGINVDVFPIDNVPDEMDKRKRYFKVLHKRSRALERKLIDISQVPLKRKILIMGYRIVTFWKSKKKTVTDLDAAAKMVNNEATTFCGNVVWGVGEKEIVHSTVFDTVLRGEFENYFYPIPGGYDEWLTNRYGDYMSLPPVEARVSEHRRKDYLIVND